jgi:hypothetical protein
MKGTFRPRVVRCSFCVLLSGTMATGRVAAQMAVGVDGSAVVITDSTRTGGAIDGRIGYRFGLPRSFIVHTVIFQPEAFVGYRYVPVDATADNAVRFGAGGRIGFLLGRLEPFVFGHFGPSRGDSHWGYSGDFGGALDARFSFWSAGLHVDYDWLSLGGTPLGHYEVGPHVEARWFCF